MSFIKLFAPPEWDADVPEESHLENLTKKAKLKRLKKSINENVDLNFVPKEEVIAESKHKKSKTAKYDEETTSNIGSHESKKKKNKNKIENLTNIIKSDKNTVSEPSSSKVFNEISSLDKEANQISEKKKKVKKHIFDDELLLKKLMSEKISLDISEPKKKRKFLNEEEKNSTPDTTKKSDDVSEEMGEFKKNKKIKLNYSAPEIEESNHNKQTSHKNAKKKLLKQEKSITHSNAEKKETPSKLSKTEKNRKRRRKKNKNLSNIPLETSSNPESTNINIILDEKNCENSIPKSVKKSKSDKKKPKTPIKFLEKNKENKIEDKNVKNNILTTNFPTPSKQTKSDKKKSSGAKMHSKKLQALLSEQLNKPEPGDLPVEVTNGGESVKTNKADRKMVREHKTLRQRMMEKLKGARFRYLNEQMYIKESKDAKLLFNEDPSAFDAYHNGYRQQVSKWPLNPLDVIINDISQLPKEYIIADLGCGDGRLSKSVPQKVHSFDLVSLDPSIQACDMSHTPLLSSQVNVVVFCLSLMGTNLMDYIMEANRILKNGGLLKIAEVESRFENVETFLKDVQKYGFSLIKSDLNQNLFYFMDFKKENDIKKRNKLPPLTLNPCLYKKR